MVENKICLNMIVKNESRIIERCLNSVLHLIDTWCIVDTGSTDGTQEIIKNLLKNKPGELIEEPWINFGVNRNQALRHAEKWGEWTLLIDADMILIDRGFNKVQLNPAIDGYDMVQDNHGTRYSNTRLLNSSKNWQCIGVTHEYYSPKNGNNTREQIDTIGFQDVSDGGSKGNKYTRDIELLTQGLIDEPENSRYMFYLAQSYRDTSQFDLAIQWYKGCAETSGWDEEAWFSSYMIGWCMIRKGELLKDVSKHLLDAWMRRPHRIEPVFELAAQMHAAKNLHQSYALYKICASENYPKDVLFIQAALYEGESLKRFAEAAYHIGKYNDSVIANMKLIESGKYQGTDLSTIQKNLWLGEASLGKYNEDQLELYLQEKRNKLKTIITE